MGTGSYPLPAPVNTFEIIELRKYSASNPTSMHVKLNNATPTLQQRPVAQNRCVFKDNFLQLRSGSFSIRINKQSYQFGPLLAPPQI